VERGNLGALQVHAQIHRRRLLRRRQNRLPVPRVIALQALDPPARVVPARHRVLQGRGHQRRAFAQKAAQAGVDEGGLHTQCRLPARGFDRLVDQGERLVQRAGLRLRKRQRGAQQRIDGRRRCAPGQRAAQHLGRAQPAQGMERQRLHAGAQRRLHLLELGRQRAPFTHALHGLRHQLQLAPQRRRGFGPGVHTLNAPRPAA